MFATQATAAMLLKSYATVRDKLYTLGVFKGSLILKQFLTERQTAG